MFYKFVIHKIFHKFKVMEMLEKNQNNYCKSTHNMSIKFKFNIILKNIVYNSKSYK